MTTRACLPAGKLRSSMVLTVRPSRTRPRGWGGSYSTWVSRLDAHRHAFQIPRAFSAGSELDPKNHPSTHPSRSSWMNTPTAASTGNTFLLSARSPDVGKREEDWVMSSSSSSIWSWWWAKIPPHIPKGFEDFFPNSKSSRVGSSSGPENAETDQQQQDATTASPSSSGPDQEAAPHSRKNEESSSSRFDSRNKKADSQQTSDGRQKKSSGPDPNPPPSSDSANLPGLVALLFLIMAFRQWMEEEERQWGEEITFVDFRNQLLLTGAVEKLQVVNKKVARVILKPDHPVLHPPDPTEALFIGQDPAPSGLDFGRTEITRVGTGGSHAKPTPHYYFYIGSVDILEEKLTKAQAHVHPADWVEVQYVSQTNWARELIRTVPNLALIAALYWGSGGFRGLTGSMGAAAGRGGAGAGRGGGPMGRLFSIGRSPAKKIKKEDIKVTFADVAGCDQAKMEVMEFVDFLKDSSRFTKLGAKIPKGALLCGPPGTGKTLLAKAVAGEAGVPFFSISGSDFIEMFVGVGPSRVRDLFAEAREEAPCIVFIDEIDAVGRQRGRGGFSGGNDERENTLNQLLVEMDGFSPTAGVVVLAGTNRVDILDQALTRPGRFDRQITVDRPDLMGRRDIFKVHLRGIKLESDIDDYAGRLAGLTPGFAGADIANLCNEAAIVAARRKGTVVTIEDFEKATDRIIAGLESNKIMSKEERSIVAHHEAGHAIAGWFLEHADPLLKVTIIPRTSGALGFAQYLPKEVFLRSQEQIMDIVCMALAGRASEEVFFGRVTTGASDDLRRVTQLVYSTIKDFGMSSKLGQLSFPRRDNDWPSEKPYSDSTAEAMDEEARAVVDAAYQRTLQLVRDHKSDVEKLAALLLEKETITHDDIVDLVGPRPFQGDAAYDEYVSSRKNINKKSERKKEADGEVQDDTQLDGLTPGLA